MSEASRSRRALLVIVTFNSFDWLPGIIQSAQEFLDDHPANCVVIIENSGDFRVVDFVTARLHSTRLLVEVAPRNEGFSNGVNRAYRRAKELMGTFDLVVLLNPDVISGGRTACDLANYATADSQAGARGVWGVVLRDELGNIDSGCARRNWNRRRYFSQLVGYPDLARFLLTSTRVLKEREIAAGSAAVTTVSGALMCISTDVLGDGLCTVLPMYLEDNEICLRSIRRGHIVKLIAGLEAVHAGAASRKSLHTHERALRIMELVESPVQCMVRFQGYGLPGIRLIILAGGLFRAMFAVSITLMRLARGENWRHSSDWLFGQLKLISWIISWSFSGRFHTDPVSLTDYFQEYSHRTGR